MTKFAYFTCNYTVRNDNPILTSNKRYEILREYYHTGSGAFLADIYDDEGKLVDSIFIGWPCAYLEGGNIWFVEEEE